MIFRLIFVSSLLAALTVRVGIGNRRTVTGSEAVVVLVLPLASVAVTARPRVKSVPLLAGGVMVSPSSWAWERVQAVAVVGAGGKLGTGRHPADGDGRQGFGTVEVAERGVDFQAMAVSSCPPPLRRSGSARRPPPPGPRWKVPTCTWPSLTVKENGISSALRLWLGVKVQVLLPLLQQAAVALVDSQVADVQGIRAVDIPLAANSCELVMRREVSSVSGECWTAPTTAHRWYR